VALPGEVLDSLQRRGLLVVSGDSGAWTLSPVLSGVVAERIAPAEAAELRSSTARWLEQEGRLEEALECSCGGPSRATISLLRRHGRTLALRGYGSRVAEVLRELRTAGDLELETIRAEALLYGRTQPLRRPGMSNKAEALMRTGELEEARALLVESIDMFLEPRIARGLHSVHVAGRTRYRAR
jgi:hypothetical protein